MLMDAWWPLWLEAEFKPTLGKALYERIRSMVDIDNEPNNHGGTWARRTSHGWYGFASKDLRTIAGAQGQGPVLTRVLRRREALGLPNGARALARQGDKARTEPGALYRDGACADAGRDGAPECFDTIQFRPTGGVSQPLIPWQNRPTFQQAIEIRK